MVKRPLLMILAYQSQGLKQKSLEFFVLDGENAFSFYKSSARLMCIFSCAFILYSYLSRGPEFEWVKRTGRNRIKH